MWCSRNDLMRQAMALAGKHLRMVGFDFNEPVDVFRIISDMDIELMFRPLDEADGYYIPPTPSRLRAGILLNSRRPLPRQRYTAAHELCHFIRKNPARIEFVSEDWVPTRQKRDVEEDFADFFAGHFLMPPKLVAHFFRKLGLKKGDLDSKDVYRLSLCMRTSYEATCNQLSHLEFLSKEQCQLIKKTKPKGIKQEWSEKLGHRDIWPIDYCMNNFLIIPTVEDKIEIRLPEIPSTGYIWDIENLHDGLLMFENSVLQFLESAGQPGQTGERKFNFSVHRRGIGNLQISLRRPWEKGYPSIETFSIRISSTEREFVGHYDMKQTLLAA